MSAKTESNGHVLEVEVTDDHIGDVVHATALEPVLESTEPRPILVTMNLSAARLKDGARSIRVVNLPADGRLSAAEAHWLAVDLGEAADQLKEMRARMGFDT